MFFFYLLSLFWSVAIVTFVCAALPASFAASHSSEGSYGLQFGFLLFVYYALNAGARIWFAKGLLGKITSKATSYCEVPWLAFSTFAVIQPPANAGYIKSIADGPWAALLRGLGPILVIMESAAAVIVCQVGGKWTKDFLERREGGWPYAFVLICAGIYGIALRSLWAIYCISDLTTAEASLTTLLITACIAVGTFALLSNSGTLVDTSMMFAYVVYNIHCATLRASEDQPKDATSLAKSQYQSASDGLADEVLARIAGLVNEVMSTDVLIVIAFRVAIFLVFLKLLPSLRGSDVDTEVCKGDEVDDVDAAVDMLSLSGKHPKQTLATLTNLRKLAMPIFIVSYTQALYSYYEDYSTDIFWWRWLAAVLGLGLYTYEVISTSREEKDELGTLYYKEE